MHPYDHARSSALRFGGQWEDYYPCHAWFDATKTIQCRFTHRALRHHLEGVEEALAVFGPAIPIIDGRKVDLRHIGLQHLDEDCGILPHARDWLIDVDAPDWIPEKIPDSDALSAVSAQRFGGEPQHYRALHEWFLATTSWCDGPEHLLFRHHSFGIFEAEVRFGPVLDIGSERRVPTRIVAERHVQSVLNRIPAAVDILRRIKSARWMLQATSPQKLGLD